MAPVCQIQPNSRYIRIAKVPESGEAGMEDVNG